MFEQLQANQGKHVVLELVNGRIITGALLTVDETFLRVAGAEGTGTIPVSAVYILWENPERPLTRENIDAAAEQAEEDPKEQTICPAAYTCAPRYSCTPPHICNIGFSCQSGAFNVPSTACTPATFTCGQQYVPFTGNCPVGVLCPAMFNGWMPPTTPAPGTMNPGVFGPGGTGGIGTAPDESKTGQPCSCAFQCGAFQFSQPCTCAFQCSGSQFNQPCSCAFQCGHSQFSQPCSCAFQCGHSQFSQPCSLQFGCGPFQYSQPCFFAFQCGAFQFGGSQCGSTGGFTCAGQKFFGLR